MINECYRKNRFVQPLGLHALSGAENSNTEAGQTRVLDQRFLENNDDQFLYDENTMQLESVGDKVACPIADSILNACGNIIDAAQYIGVTFDIRKGYNVEGYRNQIVIMWCIQDGVLTYRNHNSADFPSKMGSVEKT